VCFVSETAQVGLEKWTSVSPCLTPTAAAKEAGPARLAAAAAASAAARARAAATVVKRRKLMNFKATFESGLSYFSFKRSVPGAFNVGLIGSICTALPWRSRPPQAAAAALPRPRCSGAT